MDDEIEFENLGCVSYFFDGFPGQCGYRILGEIKLYPINSKHRELIARRFVHWIKGDINLPKKYQKYNPEYPSPILHEWNLIRRCCGRLFMTDVVPEGTREIDTKYIAELMKAKKAPPVLNPNTGNKVTHWYWDVK